MRAWLIILLLATTLPTTTHASCSIGYSSSCDSIEFTATSSVFFNVNRTATNADEETFNATVIFHWGEENVTVGPLPYEIDKPIGLSNTYKYTNEGYYQVGNTLIFEDSAAAGCSEKAFESNNVIRMERTPSVCEWNAELPAPTLSPTASTSPTISPAPTNSGLANDGGSDAGVGMRPFVISGLLLLWGILL